MHYVILTAPLDTTLKRTKARQGDGLTDETAIRTMHAQFAQADPDEWCCIDAGHRDPAGVADDVLAAWRTGQARVR